MGMLDSKMIPTENAEQLVQGSYEDIVQKVTKEIEESKKFTEDVFPVATFKNYVIVGSPSGKFFRASYTESRGKVKIKEIEKLDVPVVDESNLQDFVEKQLKNVIDSFIAGRKVEAINKLRETADLVRPKKASKLDEISSFLESLKKGDWFKYAKEKKIEGIVKLDKNVIDEQFKSLYDGSLKDSELDGFIKTVNEALDSVFEQTKKFVDIAEDAYSAYRKNPRKVNEEEKPILLKFESFAEGFVADISRKLKEGTKIVENSDCIACWAAIHDGFADIFEDVQVASGLIGYFSKQLQE